LNVLNAIINFIFIFITPIGQFLNEYAKKILERFI
jgi:hypothetical protein